MRLVTLEAGQNFIEDRDRAFMLLPDRSGVIHAVPAKCPHRGGPLHLGEFDAGRTCIRCPWHQGNVKISALTKQELPLVSARGVTTVVLEGDGACASILRRRMPKEPAEFARPAKEDRP
jgi:nitrite reductase (NADH) small subunit